MYIRCMAADGGLFSSTCTRIWQYEPAVGGMSSWEKNFFFPFFFSGYFMWWRMRKWQFREMTIVVTIYNLRDNPRLIILEAA